jgi:hypothetical protein
MRPDAFKQTLTPCVVVDQLPITDAGIRPQRRWSRGILMGFTAAGHGTFRAGKARAGGGRLKEWRGQILDYDMPSQAVLQMCYCKT